MEQTPAPETRILVADDEDDIRNMLVSFLQHRGWQVDAAATLTATRQRLDDQRYDIVLLDQYFPDGDGLELAAELDETDCEVVLMTAHASVESAIEALRTHIADFLTKPFPTLELVNTCLFQVHRMQALRRKNQALVADLERKNAELEAMVVRDRVTGLYNNSFFQDSLDREVERSSRYDLTMSLIAIHVDQLDTIREQSDRKTCERVLARIGELLRGELQDADFRVRKGDLAARFDDDELALILPHTPKRGAALKAEHLRDAVRKISFGDLGVKEVTISAGVATFPSDAATSLALARASKRALDAARLNLEDHICVYRPALEDLDESDLQDAHSLEQRMALEESIQTGAFNYHFQPILHAGLDAGGDVYGYEALVRPTHPVLPNPFALFTAAEDAGRITELGRAVRAGALSNVMKVPFPKSLFVNLHPFELNDPQLGELDGTVDDNRARIVFEITESSAIENFDHVNRRITELRERGYRIAVDDLGAGYAGLLALSRLTPDFVKLDRALVQRASNDGRTERLIRHIVDFANGEGISVVAEGIETEAERDLMREAGCSLLQGYLLGRPRSEPAA